MTRPALGAVALAAALLVAGCQEAPEEQAPLRPVRTLVVEAREASATQRLPGRLEAGVSRRLSFRVAGRLADVSVDVGEAVNAGQRLASLESTDLALQRDRARAALAGAEAAAARAEADWQRARRLYEAGSLPAQDLDAARAQHEAARAQRDSARDALTLAERQVAFTRLEAPGECRVAQRLAEAGENLPAGRPVIVLACGDAPEVSAALAEEMLDAVAVGDRLEVQLPLAEVRTSGRVHEIALPVDPRQSTWPLRVTLDRLSLEAQARLRPGMAAELWLPRPALNDGHWVPMVAVQRDAKGPYVYVAELTEEASDADGAAHRGQPAVIRRREVTLGDRQDERLEIVAGLSAGTSLVIAGMSRLQDGQRVRVMDAHREASP